MDEYIKLYHGDGGKFTNELIKELFYKYFDNDILLQGTDSAIFQAAGGSLALTTDSFVIKPLFFPGGDIGRLAVCGTINDLAVSGARPLYISTGFIIEEGFSLKALNRIVEAMSRTCKEAGVKVIAGDTKVVEKGCADGLFINTSGIGIIENDYTPKVIMPGDDIIITGTIAEHGTVIALERYNIKAAGRFFSDCAPINGLIHSLAALYPGIKLMRDPTRGGLATALNEIATANGVSISLEESKLPVRKEINAVCRMLGIDPLYLASEGRAVLVVDPSISQEILKLLKSFENGKEACIIGSIVGIDKKLVYLETTIEGKRVVNSLEQPMLPRIC